MKIHNIIQRAFAAAALACLVVSNTGAQVNSTIDCVVKTDQIKGYSIKNNVSKKSKRFTSPVMKTVNLSDYGTIDVIMEEDFSLMSTGSEENPDFDVMTGLDWMNQEDGCDSPWTNMRPEYTHVSGWGASNIFPAGGKAFMLTSIFEGSGHINTPVFDFTGYDGVAVIEFKAKTTNPDLRQMLVIESAETNHHGPAWRVLGGQPTPFLTTEWQTYQAIFFDAGESTLFNVIPQMEEWWYQLQSEEPSKVVFDDFKVYGINQFVEIPKNLAYSNYKGTEFDITWKDMNADKYLVDVYTIDSETGERNDFITGKEVTTNSMHVDGVVSGATYYFTVTAAKGDKKSFPSLPQIVFDMEDASFTGVPTIIQDHGEYSYTSEWNEIPSAEVYDYWAMHKRIAKADGEFTVFESDFDGLLDFEGNTTDWTIDLPFYSCYGMLPLEGDCIKQAGWVGKNYMPFKDFVCIDGWQHVIAGAEASITSPELDLSKDNGNIHLSVRLYGRVGGYYDPIAQEQHDNMQTKAAVSLYSYNEGTGKFEMVEYHPIDDVVMAWNTFDVDLTGGSKRSYIVISAIEGPEHLYIDDLKITQNYKAGESLVEPFLFEMFYYEPSINVQIPVMCNGEEISEKVRGLKINPVNNEYRYSKMAEQTIGYAGEPAGIEDISVSEAPITYRNGHVVVNNANGGIVKVYTADGKLVKTSGETSIILNLNKGIYMVNVGGKSIKVTL